MLQSRFDRILFIVQLFLLFSFLSEAQTGTVSPFSRYGIGELQFSGTALQSGMGRTGYAVTYSDRINFLNPATLSYDSITTVEAGIKLDLSRLSSGQQSQTVNGASVSYFAMAFPVVRKKWGASLGIIPYSSAGYSITDLEFDPECHCGNIKTVYDGSGDINRFYFSNGFSPFGNALEKYYASKAWQNDTDTVAKLKKEKFLKAVKGFSIGLNASWMFGTLNNTRSVSFVDSISFLNTRIINRTSLGDIYLSFGISYSIDLKKNHFFSLSTVAANNSSIRSTFNSLWYNYRAGVFSDLVEDTIRNIVDQKGETIIPVYFGGGIAFGKKDLWVAAADFTMQDWKEYRSFESRDSLRESNSFSFGFAWTPEVNSMNYLRKIQYRMGLRYSSSYLQLRGQHIRDYGISFGFGLPIIKKDRIQRTSLQIAIEAGQNGTEKNNLLKQQYLKFHFGIVLNELWFLKRKYE